MKPPVITEIEKLLRLELHPAPARGSDPVSGVMPVSDKQPHRYALRGNELAGLNLAGAKLTDEQWRRICALEGFRPDRIEALNLRNNQLEAARLPAGMTNLQYLDLCENRLKEFVLPEGGARALKHIWLYGNEGLNSPPPEVVDLGNAALLRYIREIQQAKPEDIRFLDEAKLIVVGQPRAGKTTLRYKLRNTETDLPAPDLTTRGIDIERLAFDFVDDAKRQRHFSYHVWDFGGQQIYHATHRFFLTKRTVYIAVVDTDVNERQNELDYWLHMIELLGEGSPVLLVQNQKSNRSIEIADTLRNRFRHILCARDYELNFDRLKRNGNPNFNENRLKDFQVFKADVETQLSRLPQPAMTKPKNDVRLALEELSQTFPLIELKDYTEVCNKNSLPGKEDQTDLLRTLHNLGVCLYYEEHDFLNRIVILQNRWATDAVFKVLDDETVKGNKGHFYRKDLDAIWQNPEYRERVSELVELMKKFKLCYQIEHTDEYIVPQLLDKNPPDDFEPNNWTTALRMVVEYEFMPRGIMTQFIVAMHPMIAGRQRCAWETGFIIEDRELPGTEGMAQESYNSRKIELFAKGPGASRLLQKMLNELDKINDSYHRLKILKKIPCVCKACSQPDATEIKEFDYKEVLREVYQNRKNTMRCSIGNEEVPVEKLTGLLGFTKDKLLEDYQKLISNNVTVNVIQNGSMTNQPTPEPRGLDIYAGLTAFVIVMAFLLFALNDLPLIKFVALVIGGLLFIPMLGAFAMLKTLSEKNFMEILRMIYGKIPGLGWLLKVFGKGA